MKNLRCQCRNVGNHLICKNRGTIIIQNKRFCSLHSQYYYGKNAYCIQNAFRAFKMRKAINIYKLLPQDLQHKILNYWYLPTLLKKHHYDVIDEILYKKLMTNTLYENKYSILNIDLYTSMCTTLLVLFVKYFKTLSTKTHEKIASSINEWEKWIIRTRFPRDIQASTFDSFLKNIVDYTKLILNTTINCYDSYLEVFLRRQHLYLDYL